MPIREIYWNISGYNWMYIFFAITMAIFIYGCYKKFQILKLGRSQDRSQPIGERIKLVLIHALGHKKILNEKFAGIFHSFIFYGFILLFIGTLLVMVEKYLGIKIMHLQSFHYYKFILDMAGLLAIIGILMAMYRRYVVKPEGLDNKNDDAVALVLILVILVTGFFISGTRLAANPVAPELLVYTPVALVFSKIFGALTSDVGTLTALHKSFWWFHMLMAFAFIAYIPYSKLFHMISSTMNQYWQNLENKAALSMINLEDESAESFGVSKLEDFTWKDLFDTEACTRCGRCQDNCPAHLTGKPLSPKELVQSIKGHLEENAPRLLAAKAAAGGETGEEAAAAAEASEEARQLIGEVIDEEVIWSCTTCGSCQEQCPVFVEHVPKVMEMRRHLVLDQGEMSAEAQLALTNMERHGNPWGVGKTTRRDWCKDLDVPTIDENGEPDVLYWVGCAGSFDGRNQKVAAAFVKVMKEAGVNFSILGNDEMCCGDSARRLGNEYLYQSLAETNIEMLNELGIKKIVTPCPHCLNALKNEYPQMGGNYEVVHHSQFILDLIKAGKIKLENPLAETVVYHDSCYLGRYNDIYHQPREILKAIPQTSLKEMERNLGKSFCCGAGGGRMWMEETIGERINITRVEQALETGASYLVTGCPFCITMMDDGVKAKEKDEQVCTRDIAELVAASMKTTQEKVAEEVS
jgi:Fe-S oxidoreductase/nitrate reductase gamma subunit